MGDLLGQFLLPFPHQALYLPFPSGLEHPLPSRMSGSGPDFAPASSLQSQAGTASAQAIYTGTPARE